MCSVNITLIINKAELSVNPLLRLSRKRLWQSSIISYLNTSALVATLFFEWNFTQRNSQSTRPINHIDYNRAYVLEIISLVESVNRKCVCVARLSVEVVCRNCLQSLTRNRFFEREALEPGFNLRILWVLRNMIR